MEESVTGYIDSILFISESNEFTIARLKEPRKNELTTILGEIPSIKEGETIHCNGAWKRHPKHGPQFEVKSFELKAPEDLYGIQKYLESGLIRGIGPVYAEKIVRHFKLDTLDVIDKTPYRLSEISGIGPKKVKLIQTCWLDQKSIRNLMIFLQSHNVRSSLAQKVYKLYGDRSIEKIKENPYALAKTIFGVGFKSADDLAQKLGIALDSPHRIQAGITYLLWELSSSGHVCFPEEDLIFRVKEMLLIAPDLIAAQVLLLEESADIVRNKLKDIMHLWIKPLYLAEIGIARELARLTEAPCYLRSITLDKAINWVEDKLHIQLAQEQQEAITISTQEKLHIITGGPGTGKSTITMAILRIIEKLTSEILLAAPTGRAAKRMTEITSKKASTIHSLLEFDFTQGGFKKNKENSLSCDLIIIDEASMIDTQLMYSLLKAIPSSARVIFIGDIDQLPSVGPGNVLKDIIHSERIPVTILKQIFRQARGSRIVRNAHSINQGYFPDIEPKKGSDFLFLEIEEPNQILEKTITLIRDRIPSHFKFNPINDIQVLIPMKKGIIGTENFNHVLQQALNPHPHPLIRMGKCLHPNDKVMQIRNNYDKKVYNGDVGRISNIDVGEQELTVKFDNMDVFYDFSELDELVLAYAVSIHKYQGSECPCVIIPIHMCHFKLLFRNLLYTGITRGKQLVILLGSKKALTICVKNDEVRQRHTGLKQIIQETLVSK